MKDSSDSWIIQFKVLLRKPLNLIRMTHEYQLKEGWSYYSELLVEVLQVVYWYGIMMTSHKDRAEYESDTIRNWVWDWYSSVFQSRIKTLLYLIMTRWKMMIYSDVFSILNEIMGIINIPVYNGLKQILYFQAIPLEFMKEKQNSMIPRDFQSLYMWDPIKRMRLII